MEEIDETQRLQNIVDRSKVYSIAKSSLTPPPKTEEDEGIQIAIIRSLAFSSDKAKDIFFEVTGTQLVKGILKVVDDNPMMNLLGGRRLLIDLKSISEVDFSYLKEDDIGEYMAHFFEEMWPYYWANRRRYEIKQMDMGHIKVKLQAFILSCFCKGKSAKLLNVVGRTFSEEWGSRIVGGEGVQQQKRNNGILEKLNPFKKMV